MDGVEELNLADAGTVDTDLPADNGLDTPGAEAAAGAVDEFGQPLAPKEPTVDELLAHYTPKEEPVDPNAAAVEQPAIPEAFQEALNISDYVKEPAQVAQAVRAASEQWDIESGKVPAYTGLEGLRVRDPATYERILTKDLIPYIEHVTGKKFGGEGEAAPDPNTPEGRIAKLEQERATEREQAQQAEQMRERNEVITRANAIGSQKMDELLKDTPFVGRSEQFFTDLGGALAKLKLDPNRVMQETLTGNFANFEKAVQAIQKQKMDDFIATSKAIKAHYLKQKNTLPTAKGGAAKTTVGDGLIGPKSTKEELSAYLAGDSAA